MIVKDGGVTTPRHHLLLTVRYLFRDNTYYLWYLDSKLYEHIYVHLIYSHPIPTSIPPISPLSRQIEIARMSLYETTEEYIPSQKDNKDAWNMHHSEGPIRPFSCVDTFCNFYRLRKDQVNLSLLNSLIQMRSDECVDKMDSDVRYVLKKLKQNVSKYVFLLPYTSKLQLIKMTDVERKFVNKQIKDVYVHVKSTYDGETDMEIQAYPLIAEEVVGRVFVFFVNNNGDFFFLGLRWIENMTIKCLKESLLLKTLDLKIQTFSGFDARNQSKKMLKVELGLGSDLNDLNSLSEHPNISSDQKKDFYEMIFNDLRKINAFPSRNFHTFKEFLHLNKIKPEQVDEEMFYCFRGLHHIECLTDHFKPEIGHLLFIAKVFQEIANQNKKQVYFGVQRPGLLLQHDPSSVDPILQNRFVKDELKLVTDMSMNPHFSQELSNLCISFLIYPDGKLFFLGLEKIRYSPIVEFKSHILKSERRNSDLRSRISRSLEAMSDSFQKDSGDRIDILPVHSNSTQTSPIHVEELKKEKERDKENGRHESLQTKYHDSKLSHLIPNKNKNKKLSKKQSAKLKVGILDKHEKKVLEAKKETRKEMFLERLKEVKKKKEEEKQRQEEILLKRMDFLKIGNDILFEELMISKES